VFPSLLRALKSTWLDCEPVAVYGSTEAEPIAHIALNEISPEDFAAMGSGRGLLAGHPVTEIDLAIIANQWGKPIGPFTKAGFSKEQLPAGTAGEIVVAGDHVLRGYLGGRGDAETKFRVDDRIWHRTGDVGYLDAAGRLWLVGRCSARMVDSLGELHPFSVECVARQFDWVRLAGCVAVNGIRCLAVEPRTPPSAEDELKLLQAVSWAHIQQIHLVNPMPVDRRHNAKIDYAALVQRISQPGSTLCLK
jgi:acyl-CoA synthetase (AMP-forming)/AMP-acid ligase II